jgi:hypothetical protein
MFAVNDCAQMSSSLLLDNRDVAFQCMGQDLVVTKPVSDFVHQVLGFSTIDTKCTAEDLDVRTPETFKCARQDI